jgi:hypothetical protein
MAWCLYKHRIRLHGIVLKHTDNFTIHISKHLTLKTVILHFWVYLHIHGNERNTNYILEILITCT